MIKALVSKNNYIINMLRDNNIHNTKFFNQKISKKVFRQTGIIVLKKFLIKYLKLKRSFFEIKESIDIVLRFIENDIKIQSYIINKTMIGIDTKKDYINFLKKLKMRIKQYQLLVLV